MSLTLRKFKQFVEVPQVCLRNGAIFLLKTGGCDTTLCKAYSGILWGCPWIILKLKHMGHTWGIHYIHYMHYIWCNFFGCDRSWAFLGALFSIFKSVTDTSYFKYICGGTASLSAKRRIFLLKTGGCDTPLCKAYFDILWGCPWIIIKLKHMGHTWGRHYIHYIHLHALHTVWGCPWIILKLKHMGHTLHTLHALHMVHFFWM